MIKFKLLAGALLMVQTLLVGYGVYDMAAGIAEGSPERMGIGAFIVVGNLVFAPMNVRILLDV